MVSNFDKIVVEINASSMDLVEEVNNHKDIKSIVEELTRIVKEKDFWEDYEITKKVIIVWC